MWLVEKGLVRDKPIECLFLTGAKYIGLFLLSVSNLREIHLTAGYIFRKTFL